MKRFVFYGILFLTELAGILTTWIVDGATTISYNTGSDISYTWNMWTSAEQLFTWVWTITITDCDGTNEDSCIKITMLDRNLWAIKTWTTCSEIDTWACGYYFQWWNNFGFDSDVLPMTSNVKVSSGDVVAWYMSWVFVTVNNDNWIDDDSKIDMWWWTVNSTTDLFDASWENIMPARGDPLANFRSTYPNSNDWKVDSEIVSSRQWPCPDGFHVPSAWEWIKVLSMLDYAYDSGQGWVIDIINNNLLIPFAGYRDWKDGAFSFDNNTYLWLSSPYWISSSASQFIALLPLFGVIFVNGGYARSNAESLRCFYNKYEIYCPKWTHLEWDECINNSSTAQCDLAWVPDNSIPTIEDVTIIWDISLNGGQWWWQIPTCEFTCNDWYTWANCEAIEYTLTVDLWDWRTQTITWYYGDPITVPQNPTRDWYSFVWWNPDFPTTMPAEDMVITAKWMEKSNWRSGWWGSRRNKTDMSTQEEDKASSNAENLIQNETKWNEESINVHMHFSAEDSELHDYTQEFLNAYKFAHEKWITTMDNIDKADMRWWLTRIAMAKMLSQYAINVLWRKPANVIVTEFWDVDSKLDSDYDNWVMLAYQLWIMWINMEDNLFRPYDLVTRAEFGTALSRMLYWIADGEELYYLPHLAKLLAEKIIINDNPELEELRWYVMIMLMRSAK